MIVDRLRSRDLGDRVQRVARLRWDGGEFDLRFELPAEWAAPPEDGSPFLAATLQLAMRLGEDLVVDAPVSARLVRTSAEIQQIYAGWDTRLRICEIQVEDELRAARPGDASVSFFSRGVDSMYSALCDREQPLSSLLFCDGLDTGQAERVRAEEVRLATEAAAAIGLPLTVASTNLRTLVDTFGIDWEDYVAPGLASMAHALAGGLKRAVIPSSDIYATLEPCGTGPLLDPLFSTEAVEIEHDSIAPSRAAKIAWLSAHRPDVLRWLKVCFFVNDPGNCGECGKCLLTMVELAVAGALAQAALFPPAIDLDAVRRMRVRTRKARIDWLEALGLVEAGGGPDELAGAIREALDRGTRDFQAELVAGRAPLRSFRSGAVNSYLELLHDPPSAPELHDAIGLVRSVDAGRHTYTAGALGSGRLAGELGSLHAHAGEIPVWITDDGRVVTRDYSPIVEPPAVGSITRWLLAPLGWRRFPQRAARLAAVPRRALALRRRLPRCAAPGGEPVGFIHDDAGENRLPLYSAVHPITGDQLLSTCRWEPIDLGYADVTQLGYLDPHAPITGRAGTINPRLTWASRFGQVVRQA